MTNENDIKVATCKAPVNIAFIKYWGKRDKVLILPLNDSLSGTLASDELYSITTIACSKSFSENRMWLNNEEQPFETNTRLMKVLNELKLLAERNGTDPELLKQNVHICSTNTFPTAAGLASSASGLAALVKTLATLYEIDSVELSQIARMGSGSACRSMYGGFVQWIKGVLPDGTDSIAKQLYPASHWPDLHVLILLTSLDKKKVGSTIGMDETAQTSQLFQYRLEHCVDKRLEELIEAIKHKDFPQFAKLTMIDSNQLHAVCLDTYPPVTYLNDVSHRIIDLVHEYNKNEVKVAYTFDAGPNACLYMHRDEIPKFTSLLKQVFPSDSSDGIEFRGLPIESQIISVENVQKFKTIEPNLIRGVIHTKLGDGPEILDSVHQSLLDDKGWPKSIVTRKK